MDKDEKIPRGINDSPAEETTREGHAEEPQEGSAFLDLLHVLGFRKKKTVSDSSGREHSDVATVVDEEELIIDVSTAEIVSDLEQEVRESSWGNFDITGDIQVNDPGELPIVKNSSQKWIRILAAILAAILATAVLATVAKIGFLLLKEPKPPAPDVVGSYNGKNITIEELEAFIAIEGAKEREHMLCPNHGYDHSKCEPIEECERHPIHTLEGYQEMVTRLAVEQMVLDWANEKGLMQRDDVRHEMEDLINDATVEQFISQLHGENITAESISEWEVQQYYSENMKQFSGKTLVEVEDEIRQILVQQKDETFFGDYIEELKKTAGLQVDFDVLQTATPTAAEIEAYYNANLEQYQIAETATYSEIHMSGSDSASATEAIRKIRSGESFESVAKTYSECGDVESTTIEKGKGDTAIEEQLWKMRLGAVSDVITKADGDLSIIRLDETNASGYTPLSEVSGEIESELLLRIMDDEYTLRKGDMLFSIHSRRYTLGDFYTEFKELSKVYQTALSTFEAKKMLVEQIISMELLLEKSEDGAASDDAETHDLEELRVQYLWQILHEEEVDAIQKEPTKDEIRDFYENNPDILTTPASVELNLIWIDQGSSGEKKEQAFKKAKEALSLLNSGTDFAEVARNYSEDASASEGGAISGLLYEDHLAPALAEPAFSMEVGEFSEVIDYYYGYYIIQVRARTEAVLAPLEELSDTIKHYLEELDHEERTAEMEQRLLDEAGFVVYDRTLRQLIKNQEKSEK